MRIVQREVNGIMYDVNKALRLGSKTVGNYRVPNRNSWVCFDLYCDMYEVRYFFHVWGGSETPYRNYSNLFHRWMQGCDVVPFTRKQAEYFAKKYLTKQEYKLGFEMIEQRTEHYREQRKRNLRNERRRELYAIKRKKILEERAKAAAEPTKVHTENEDV